MVIVWHELILYGYDYSNPAHLRARRRKLRRRKTYHVIVAWRLPSWDHSPLSGNQEGHRKLETRCHDFRQMLPWKKEEGSKTPKS